MAMTELGAHLMASALAREPWQVWTFYEIHHLVGGAAKNCRGDLMHLWNSCGVLHLRGDRFAPNNEALLDQIEIFLDVVEQGEDPSDTTLMSEVLLVWAGVPAGTKRQWQVKKRYNSLKGKMP